LIAGLERSIGHEPNLVELTNGDLVFGTRKGDLALWRIKSGSFELTKIIPCHTFPIGCIEALANGNVACSSWDATIQIWNLESDVMVHSLCGDLEVSKLVKLSNGHLASLLIDLTVTVWNVEKERRLKTFTLGLVDLCPFIALPNEQIATVLDSSRANISVFNSNTGELHQSLVGHSRELCSLVLLNDTHMASSSFDLTIKIWDLASGHVVRTLPGLINNSVTFLALLCDDVLACYPFPNESSTTIQLWKWKTGELWKTIEVNQKGVYLVRPLIKSSNDQPRLICFFKDGCIRFLNVV
jgi:WD40 repeat protein